MLPNHCFCQTKITFCFFYEQPIYKQPAYEWQIAEQLSELNALLVSNNKKLQIKEKWTFSLVINAEQLLNRQYIKIPLSLKHYWEKFKPLIIDIDFKSWKWFFPRRHRLLGQTTIQLLTTLRLRPDPSRI